MMAGVKRRPRAAAAAMAIGVGVMIVGIVTLSAAGPREDAAALTSALPAAPEGWRRARTNVAISGPDGYAWAHFTGPDGAAVRLCIGTGKVPTKVLVRRARDDMPKKAELLQGAWTSPDGGRRTRFAIAFSNGAKGTAMGLLDAVRWSRLDKITGLPKDE